MRAATFRAATLLAVFFLLPGSIYVSHAQGIGNHRAVYDAHGLLMPWTSWRNALDREMSWYERCPLEHGYPRFITLTFMDGNYRPVTRRKDMIPAMQLGMGIISYLKYDAWTGHRGEKVLAIARSMGDYLLKEAVTPDEGKYPLFFRSTGKARMFPQPPDCGCQADRPHDVQPDKAAIASYALVLLTERTKDPRYLDAALRNARTLVRNMRAGDADHSPWPMRVDYRTGEPRGEIAANQSYALRLFDKLIEHGYSEFQAPRNALWSWIRDFQIPSAARDGKLFLQFFEDYDKPGNRNSWSACSLAKYLIEKRDALDPQWKAHARVLIEFVINNFTGIVDGVPICGEQDDDRKPWGGANSTYGSTLAMYSAATGDNEYKLLAWQSLNFCMYAIDKDGCPGQCAVDPGRGGWQEDAHTDVIHNFMDAVAAFPQWGR